MALAQQVNYSTVVTPLLLPFCNLSQEDALWDWTEELDTIFKNACKDLADKGEDGIKIFDPYKITTLLTELCKHGIILPSSAPTQLKLKLELSLVLVPLNPATHPTTDRESIF